MQAALLAAVQPDNTPHGYNLTFAFPMLMFIIIAGALYLRFRKPHRVPGRAGLASAARQANDPAGVATVTAAPAATATPPATATAEAAPTTQAPVQAASSADAVPSADAAPPTAKPDVPASARQSAESAQDTA